MKTRHYFLFIIFGLFSISAYHYVADIISRLGMEHKNAQRNIFANFIGRFDNGPLDPGFSSESFQLPRPKLLSAIVSGDQPSAAKELCSYIKDYVNSEEFIRDYNAAKEDAIPIRYNGNGISTLKANIAVYELNIKNYPKDLKYVAEQKQLLERDKKGVDSILEVSKKPFENRDIWEKTYPDNPEVIIKKRLEEYLALSAKVDFNAQLTEPDKYNIRMFVNPAYEKKSAQWKAIYRAGKEVNDVVTTFIKDWLKGDIISETKTKIPVDMVVKDSEISSSKVAETASEDKGAQTENTDQEPTQDAVVQPEKAKKSLLGKLKDKAKAIIKD